METQFLCKNKGRRQAVRSPKDANGNAIAPILNGIDYLEVASEDQLTLKVYFIHNLPGQTNQVPPLPAPKLSEGNILIEGGQRVKNIKAVYVYSNDNVLTVTVNVRGDFSVYKLGIITSPTNLLPPKGFDPQLSTIDFSFKVDCPSEFDCKPVKECPPARMTNPDINYLAKDYSSFRQLMLDRLSVIMPEWRERNPADIQMALVELLAYVGDHLSYYQDAVATEAYLGTARSRISVRRHARLLDYHMHDGCNARTWLNIEIDESGAAEDASLPAGTPVLTGGSDHSVILAHNDLDKAVNEHALVFETMHKLTLRFAHNKISFYTWSDYECCLPRGSTRATLLNNPPLSLQEGDVLVFEEIRSPTTGKTEDADRSHRHAVRLKLVIEKDSSGNALTDPLNGTPIVEIEWHEEDALPFPLCLSVLVPTVNSSKEVKEISVARGNIVLADHGLSLQPERLIPEAAPEKGDYRPRLQKKGLSFFVPYDHKDARTQPASRVLNQDPREALPAVKRLKNGGDAWIVRRELLSSDRFANEFVVEMERDGTAYLRFGDDVMGKRPSAGSEFSAVYRIGNGPAGNVGAETIKRIVWNMGGIASVNNLLPAVGGSEAETMEEVRLFAPEAFRTQERAVTEADYAEVAVLHSEVQKAAATFRWTGSWYTVFVTIDRKKGLSVSEDEAFKKEMLAHLEKYRIAGYDLEVNGPVYIPLEIVMMVCVKPDYFVTDVKKTLLEVFSRFDLPNGEQGFFHPDNFTFGQPVYLSRIYMKAMEVEGVASVEVKRFKRWGNMPNQELENGILATESLEIVRLDNDPNYPENGKIEFDMHGGL